MPPLVYVIFTFIVAAIFVTCLDFLFFVCGLRLRRFGFRPFFFVCLVLFGDALVLYVLFGDGVFYYSACILCD